MDMMASSTSANGMFLANIQVGTELGVYIESLRATGDKQYLINMPVNSKLVSASWSPVKSRF